MITYKYKAYHLPSGNIYEKELSKHSSAEGIVIYGYNQFLEVINRWNYIASRSPKISWVYVAEPNQI